MTVTEEEARKKQCCQSHHPFDMHPKERCIASECMAWAWAGWVNVNPDGTLEIGEREGLHIMPYGPTECSSGCVRVGFCGLAGSQP